MADISETIFTRVTEQGGAPLIFTRCSHTTHGLGGKFLRCGYERWLKRNVCHTRWLKSLRVLRFLPTLSSG